MKNIKNSIWQSVVKILNPGMTFADIQNNKSKNWIFSPERIRFLFQKNGQPFFSPALTYVYLIVKDVVNNMSRSVFTRLKAVSDTNIEISFESMKVCEADFIIYGDEGSDVADQLRLGFFSDEIRTYLKKNGLFFIPDIKSPVSSFEEINKTWFSRQDFSIVFVSNISRCESVNRISQGDILPPPKEARASCSTVATH